MNNTIRCHKCAKFLRNASLNEIRKLSGNPAAIIEFCPSCKKDITKKVREGLDP